MNIQTPHCERHLQRGRNSRNKDKSLNRFLHPYNVCYFHAISATLDQHIVQDLRLPEFRTKTQSYINSSLAQLQKIRHINNGTQNRIRLDCFCTDIMFVFVASGVQR